MGILIRYGILYLYGYVDSKEEDVQNDGDGGRKTMENGWDRRGTRVIMDQSSGGRYPKCPSK
jgi:hypothetical protein